MTHRAPLAQRVLEALTRRPSSAERDHERRAVTEKQAELEERIRALEDQVHGLGDRTGELERRQGFNPSYAGPERRKHVSH